ncbi:MAG: histidine phosphatase family protein [Firmicutes bacterium]|nr:histidine phosphatase family protein [Bacillota bacterium]
MSTYAAQKSSAQIGQRPETKFCLVRHGSTDWNVENRIQGCTDTPLNQQGREEVAMLAESLQGQGWEFIVTSNLQRARESGEILGAALQIPVFSYRDLHERKFGPLEGMNFHEIKEKYPEGSDQLSLPGLETRAEIERRALQAMNCLAELFQGRQLIIVTHGGFLRAFFRAGLGLERRAPANAGKVEVRWDGSWELVEGGENSEL